MRMMPTTGMSGGEVLVMRAIISFPPSSALWLDGGEDENDDDDDDDDDDEAIAPVMKLEVTVDDGDGKVSR